MTIVTNCLSIVFCLSLINCVEYHCESNRFPLVTDLEPADCDNTNNMYYRENGVNSCFPACLEASPPKSCGQLQCPPGYSCIGSICQENKKSCYRYYTNDDEIEYTTAMWKPTCLPDESWAPKQCKGEAANGRCFCFDPEGNRIFGEAFSLDAEDMTCACSRRRVELENSGNHVFVSLHCDSMGNYDPLQCDMNSEQCWCVEPKTGDLSSIVVPISLMDKLPCYNSTTIGSQYLRQCESELYAQVKITDEFLAHGTRRLNFDTIRCQYDGSYGPSKIINGIIYCVWKDGTSLGSQAAVDSTVDTINCNCGRDQKIYELAGLTFSLTCSGNGNYQAIQMDGSQYYCVDNDGFIKSGNMNTEPDCSTYM